MENKLEKIGQNSFMDNFVKTDDILKDMCGIIESSHKAAYQAVNIALVQRNWLIGYRIAEEELGGDERSEYGVEVINEISKELMYEIAKYNCNYVTSKVFKYLTDVQTPQGILAVIEKTPKDQEIDYSQDIIVALDDIQDPGNLGTILRTVDSVGLTQILVSKETADSFNPKVVRSTMGAIFRVKVIECDNLKEKLKEAKKHKYKIVVSSLQTNNSVYDINYNKKVIVIGNEANGVEKEIQDMADEKIKIPMLGKTESLNASVATGIILYEYVRQKVSKK